MCDRVCVRGICVERVCVRGVLRGVCVIECVKGVCVKEGEPVNSFRHRGSNPLDISWP